MSIQTNENPVIPIDYHQKITNEVGFYKDCHNVHELPDIFHYWSNKYLRPKQERFGFSNPEDFFISQCLHKAGATEHLSILSVGSGNGELEIKLAGALKASGFDAFVVTCLDLNPHMLERARLAAEVAGVAVHITTVQADFNHWQAAENERYDVIMANQSLHHVLELEHLFDAIHAALDDHGLFLTSDMIGRNGHMRWPEAMRAMQPFWNELPESYRYNQILRRQEDQFINHDCSTDGFEGIRAQDILPLLTERFGFELFIPFANLIIPFIDRSFGHHFNATAPWDTGFIDRVHAADEKLINQGRIKPTQMLAVMNKHKDTKPHLLQPHLTPAFCIRPC